jgi:hypothetical protein
MMQRRWCKIILWSAALPLALHAQTFSGRFTSAFYAYERSDSANLSHGMARGYQIFQIDWAKQNFLVRMYGQLDRDFSTPLAGDGKARVFNFYFEWKNLFQHADVQLGRQPVFAGAGVGTIDGAQIKIRPSKQWRIKAYAGGLLPRDQNGKTIDDLDKNYMAGGQLVWTPNADLNLGVSFYDKRQLRPGYEALRADSIGNVFTQFVEPNDLAYRVGAFDASWYANAKTSFYGRSDYDFHAEQITRAELSTRAEVSTRLVLTGNYIFRSPRLPQNSLFSLFDVENNHEVEAGFYYQHKPSLRFYGNAAGIFYTDDESFRFTVGSDCKYGGVSFVQRTGYAGDLRGVNASLYYPTRSGMVLPSVQLSWASYKLEADQAEREALYSGAAGLLVRPWKKLTFDGQLQLLHNRYYSHDLRFLFRVQYWFFNKLGADL